MKHCYHDANYYGNSIMISTGGSLNSRTYRCCFCGEYQTIYLKQKPNCGSFAPFDTWQELDTSQECSERK